MPMVPPARSNPTMIFSHGISSTLFHRTIPALDPLHFLRCNAIVVCPAFKPFPGMVCLTLLSLSDLSGGGYYWVSERSTRLTTATRLR